MTIGRLPGAVILVQQHGKPVYLEEFRRARHQDRLADDAGHDLRHPLHDQADHVPGAMMLIDEGKLALTDPVSKYVPLFADTKVGVEPEAHREGRTRAADPSCQHRGSAAANLGHQLRLYRRTWVMQVYQAANIFEGPFNNRQFADRIAKLPLTRSPERCGARPFHRRARPVIEIISGQTLYEFLKQRIFDPLGMTAPNSC